MFQVIEKRPKTEIKPQESPLEGRGGLRKIASRTARGRNDPRH